MGVSNEAVAARQRLNAGARNLPQRNNRGKRINWGLTPKKSPV